MRKASLFGILIILFTLAVVTGCVNQQGGGTKGGAKTTPKDGEDEDHSHGAGPHGGTVADWANGKYHVEFCVDHGKKEATVYLLKADAKTPVPIKTDKLLLSIKQPSFQVELKALTQPGDPAEKASRFVGTHDNFGKEQEFAGTISGEVDGTPYAGDFQEEPESQGHKHGKK